MTDEALEAWMARGRQAEAEACSDGASGSMEFACNQAAVTNRAGAPLCAEHAEKWDRMVAWAEEHPEPDDDEPFPADAHLIAEAAGIAELAHEVAERASELLEATESLEEAVEAVGHQDLFDDGLFAVDRDPSILLRDRYLEPPFTVLDRRAAAWQSRDRLWKSLGIQSELGREGALVYDSPQSRFDNWFRVKNEAMKALGVDKMTDAEMLASPWAAQLTSYNASGGTSVFNPTLCELMLRWYSAAGDHVFDPFAGGSVRGVVSSTLGRHYTGIELRAEQVEANRAQEHLGGASAHVPRWIAGDSMDAPTLLPGGYQADMVLSCPPYAYLEEYSDDPRDLSSMSYPDFLVAYREIIRRTVAAVRDDRFLVWVVGEVREKGGDGSLVGLVPDTVQAFRDAGAEPYNDHIVVLPVGTVAVRTPKQFDTSRKAGRIHEYVLVFVKGNARAATDRLGAVR